MPNENITVNVEVGLYANLVAQRTERDILIRTLLGSADLNYNKTSLVYSDSIINALLEAICPGQLLLRFEELKAAQEQEA